MPEQAVSLPLREIHLPDTISWWPPAIGWWLVIGVLIGLLFFIIWAVKNYFKPSLKHEAAKALKKIEASFYENEDVGQCLSQLSTFLRQVTLTLHASKYAGLTGQNWLLLLDQQVKEPEFSQGVGQLLLSAPYRPIVKKEEAFQLIELCQKWVKGL